MHVPRHHPIVSPAVEIAEVLHELPHGREVVALHAQPVAQIDSEGHETALHPPVNMGTKEVVVTRGGPCTIKLIRYNITL